MRRLRSAPYCVLGTALVSAAVLLAHLFSSPRDSESTRAEEITRTPAPLARALRRPVAMVLVDGGRRLLVANRRRGSVSVIDANSRSVVREDSLGRRFSDLTAVGETPFLLATDEAAHELLLLSRRGEALTVVQRLPVAKYPVSVRVNSDRSRCFVASLWSRRLAVVDLNWRKDSSTKRSGPPRMSLRKTMDMPLAPRVQLLVKDGSKLLVADSFGGKLAIVDSAAAKVEAVRELPAHNIRGMALTPDGKKLLVSHQILNDLAETTHNDVHWGVLMSNVLRWLVLDNVLDSERAILKDSHVHLAGDTNDAGGDPAAVSVTRDGRAVIALSGVDQVGIVRERNYSLRRLDIGRRPTSLVLSPDDRRAYVANTFGDSVSIVDLDKAQVSGEISLGPRPQLSHIERGESLFHNARLSLDGWFSCHSCHTDGHSNGVLNDNQGDNSFGAPKRVLSLLGVGQTAPWAWNGKMTDLKAQIRKSITSTMQGKKPKEEDVAALAAYLRTLKPPPPLSAARDETDHAAIARGEKVFHGLGCAECHQPPTYSSRESYDVDLPDELGVRRFNPPSLRGVSQRGPFFHDNRAATLEELLVKHRHGLAEKLNVEELQDLLRFLERL